MKEKRIDIHLSFVSLVHLGIIGSAGALAVELFADNGRTQVLYASLTCVLVLIVLMIIVYYVAYQKIKRKK